MSKLGREENLIVAEFNTQILPSQIKIGYINKKTFKSIKIKLYNVKSAINLDSTNIAKIKVKMHKMCRRTSAFQLQRSSKMYPLPR